MSTSGEILCDVCHERRATNHFCQANTGKTTALCDDCFQTSMPPEILEIMTAPFRDAHCEYCGGQACMGGSNSFAFFTGEKKLRYKCMPCTMEHYRFIQGQTQMDPSGLSQQEQMVLLRKLFKDADEHLKQWVAKRGSP